MMCKEAGWGLSEIMSLSLDEFCFWYEELLKMLEKKAQVIDEIDDVFSDVFSKEKALS